MQLTTKTLGLNLRSARTLKQLTQAQVAEEAGMTMPAYRAVECGTRSLKATELAAICKVMDLSADSLLFLCSPDHRVKVLTREAQLGRLTTEQALELQRLQETRDQWENL